MGIKHYDQKYRRENTNCAEKYNFEMTELRFSGVFLNSVANTDADKNGIMEVTIKTYKGYPSGSSRSAFETTHLTRKETEELRDHLTELLNDRVRW